MEQLCTNNPFCYGNESCKEYDASSKENDYRYKTSMYPLAVLDAKKGVDSCLLSLNEIIEKEMLLHLKKKDGINIAISSAKMLVHLGTPLKAYLEASKYDMEGLVDNEEIERKIYAEAVLQYNAQYEKENPKAYEVWRRTPEGQSLFDKIRRQVV